MISKCNICESSAVRKTTNDEIYGRIYGNGMIYLCDDCRSYVGCHPCGKPLGILSDPNMRELKKKCHSLFDPVWKHKIKKRGDCYQILAKKLGIKIRDCHFGMFDTPMLNKALAVLNDKDWYEV